MRLLDWIAGGSIAGLAGAGLLAAVALPQPAAAAEGAPSAIELPGLPLSPYERALRLEALGLETEALRSWEELLATAPAGPRAAEAAGRRDALLQAVRKPSRYEEASQRVNEALRSVADPAGLEAMLADEAFADALAVLEGAGDRFFRLVVEHLRGLDAAAWKRRAAEALAYPEHRADALAGRSKGGEPLVSADPLLGLRFEQVAIYDLIQRGDDERALVLLDAVEKRCAVWRCSLDAALARSDRGAVLLRAGDLRGAVAHFEAALALIPEEDDLRRSELLVKQGLAVMLAGEVDRATDLLLEAARRARAAGEDAVVSVALLNLAGAARARGDDPLAAAYALEAQRVAERGGPARVGWKAENVLAGVWLRQGRVEDARKLLEAAWPRHEAGGLPDVMASNRRHLGNALLAGGELEAAVERFREALQLAPGPSEIVWEVSGALGAALLELGEREEAAGALEAAVESATWLLARSPARAREVGAALVRTRALLAVLRAEQAGAEAGWKVFAPGATLDTTANGCLLAPVRLPDGIALLLADEVGATFAWVAGAGTPAEAGKAWEASRCGTGKRHVHLVETGTDDLDAWERHLRRAHPGISLNRTEGPAALLSE